MSKVDWKFSYNLIYFKYTIKIANKTIIDKQKYH